MAKLITDPAGSPHMLQLVQASSGDLLQRHWIWDDGRWSVEEYINLASGVLGEGVSVESAISSDGILAMILLAQTMTQPGTPDHYGLFFKSCAGFAASLGQPLPPVTVQFQIDQYSYHHHQLVL
jgi:hypothetical protein